MKAALTDRLIQSLKPDLQRPYEVRDTKLQGFLLRVQPSGVMSYVCQYRRGKRATLGRVGIITLGRARKKAMDILSAEQEGGYVPEKKRIDADIDTLGAFLDKEYVPWFKAHRKPPYSNLSNLNTFKPYRDRKLADIDIRLIERWSASMRTAGKADSTIKRYLNSLYAVLSKAVEWGVIDKHPLKGMTRIKTDDIGRVRFLAADEESRLMGVLTARDERLNGTDYLKTIVQLAKNTGMRKGEILALKWSDVNLANKLITVRGEVAKSSKTRHIPMNTLVVNILTTWQKQSPDGYLFNVGSFDKAWRAVVADAGLIDFKFHDLRHDFASKLVMAGVDLKTIQELLGHADLTMTLRYAHLAPSHKADAVERLQTVQGG